MKTVYKYHLMPTDLQNIALPKGAEILTVANQREAFVLYARVDKSVAETELRTIRIAGTGHDIGDGLQYIGSAMFAEDDLVFHVFEVLP